MKFILIVLIVSISNYNCYAKCLFKANWSDSKFEITDTDLTELKDTEYETFTKICPNLSKKSTIINSKLIILLN